MVAYTASKAAVAAMTVAMAEELKHKGILVNAVAPSTLDTQANRDSMPDADFSNMGQPGGRGRSDRLSCLARQSGHERHACSALRQGLTAIPLTQLRTENR
ncbi:SDR family NAD(P)-dependent oxidoreductase [Mesorhizobium atlanticum]